MRFATITPDRGDRPQFFEFCKYQLSRMTIKPDATYFINHWPKDNNIDLLERVQAGIKMARYDGFDFVFIMENDDFYPADYFYKMFQFEQDEFIGSEKTRLYNIEKRTFGTVDHPDRSSLFNTGFRISSLENFLWPKNTVYLDMHLWEFALSSKKNMRFVDNGTVSIKHSIGLLGGKAHGRPLKNKDGNLEWLKANVDYQAFNFYKSLMKW